ncbi:MAG: HEAT repeat domain-containing protein [Haloarculaceae archaeon]
MSNGDDAADDEAADEGATVEEFEARLDDAEVDLDAAVTEADLDDVEATLEDIEADLESADLPEPDEDEEDAEDPRDELESRLSDLRDSLDEQRGPYVEDVAEIVESASSTVAETRWTDDGLDDVAAAVESFLDAAGEHVDVAADAGEDAEANADALSAVADTLAGSNLDPDDDEETIAALLEAAETLDDDLEAAEEWDDLSVREQLEAQGFYDVLTGKNRKDYPPEWSAIKIYAKQGEVEPILLALEKLDDSDFMEEYVFDALEHLGPEAEPAFEELHSRAQKRNKAPIRVLGKIGDDRACETFHEFIDGDGDPALQKVTLRALGQIGSEESTQPVANRLAADSAEVRSVAARALGLIGDTRAIEPLADVLAEDEADEVRASAAWALNQIGTERALDVAAEYADDRSYIVQAEAEKAASA